MKKAKIKKYIDQAQRARENLDSYERKVRKLVGAEIGFPVEGHPILEDLIIDTIDAHGSVEIIFKEIEKTNNIKRS